MKRDEWESADRERHKQMGGEKEWHSLSNEFHSDQKAGFTRGSQN